MENSSLISTGSARTSSTWVESMGGPLIVIPVSVLDGWRGCTESGMVLSDGDTADDYDRACEVEGLAGVVDVGRDGDECGLVLADQPATTCYLPELQTFVRWLGAGSEADLIAAATAVLADPTVEWEEYGVWETDGPAVLMDSATEGAELDVAYPGGGTPEQAPVSIPSGRWTIRAVNASVGEDTSVGLVRLLPASA